MGTRLVERRLNAASRRLSELRDELRIADDQLSHLETEAEELEVRALVSETPAASFEYRDAKAHADAMRRHRQHLVVSIQELERRLDDLLDRMKVSSHGKSLS
jgi:chromosome segregation ATPase